MKKVIFAITFIFSFVIHTLAQESKTYYEKITGTGTANGGKYNYEATLQTKIFNSGFGGVAVKIGIKEYKITSFTYKDEFYHKTNEGFPIQINNIQSDLIDGWLNIKSTTGHYSVAEQKFSLLGVRKGHLDNIDLNTENIKSIKNYNNGGKVSFDDFYVEFYAKLKNTYFEELSKITTIIDAKVSVEKEKSYISQKKAEAQETLKEIEIEQERERKAQEREALKSKNYYKTSPNTIRTGGYPQNGYNQAMQNINRMDANYDALKQSINKLANTFSSGTKSKSIDLDEIDQYNSNQDRVRDRRKQELQAIYDAFTIIYTINEGDDYPFLETGIYSDEYKTFIETLQHTTATHLFVKYIGWEKLAGAENIKAYHSMSKMYMGSKNEFDSNERPVFKILFGNTQSISVTEILKHPYLFSLYMEGLPKKVISLSPATFSGKEVTAVADCHFMFLDESVLDQMVGQIKSTYQSANTLQFDSYYKTYQKPFHQYVSENLEKETQYYNKIEEFKKKKIIADKKISKKTENVKSTEIIDNKFFYRTKKHRKLIYYDNKNALIDENGEFLINPTFNKIRQIKNTHLYAIIKEEGKDGSDIILDANIFDPIKKEVYGDNNIYLILWNNSEYIILVNKQTHKKGIFNALTISSNKQSDKYKVPFLFDRIEAIDRSKLMVSNNGMKGLITNNSEVIIPFKYKDIIKEEMYLTTNYYCQTFENEKIWHMYDHRGKFKGTYKKTRSGFKLK